MTEEVSKAMQISTATTPIIALLAEFRVKVEQAINLVSQMSTEEMVDAVECWNMFSEKLQEIVHRSFEFAEIEAIALSLEEPGHENPSNKTDCVVIDSNIKTISNVQEIGGKTCEKTDSIVDGLNKNISVDVDSLINCNEVSQGDRSDNKVASCEMKSKSKTEVVSERETNDSERLESEKSWKCRLCSKRYKERKSLKVHLRKHSGDRPYKCDVCGKSFGQSGTLLSHRAVHSDARPHACTVCGRGFRQRSQLRMHMLRHDNVKRYQCKTCQFKFLTRGDLVRHEKTHTGERQYRCDICYKSYARRQSLELHLRKKCGLTAIDIQHLLKVPANSD